MTNPKQSLLEPTLKPNVSMQEDPRLDPRIAEALELFPYNYTDVPPMGSDYQNTLRGIAAMEAQDLSRHSLLESLLPEVPNVEVSEEIITCSDGHSISVFIHRPSDQSEALPGIVHLHGGGMAMMSATDPGYRFLRNQLAQMGMVVVGVEFRNSAGRLGSFPFPTGLNDCAGAVNWVFARKRQLAMSSLILCGESGGGNLSLATAIKARREGWIDQIDGVYASCPFISGQYAKPPTGLESILECDGYMLDRHMTTAMVKAYDPDGDHSNNPLAWPMHAQQSDLKGLPAHVISVNELDPLRDEGLAYAKALADAEVVHKSRIVRGTPHGGELMFNQLVPDLFASTLHSIHNFAVNAEERRSDVV